MRFQPTRNNDGTNEDSATSTDTLLSLSTNNKRDQQQQQQYSSLLLLQQALLSPTSCEPPPPPSSRTSRRIGKHHPPPHPTLSIQHLPRIEENENDTNLSSFPILSTNNNNERNEDVGYNPMMNHPNEKQGDSEDDNNNNNTSSSSSISSGNPNRSSFVETSFTFQNFWSAFIATTAHQPTTTGTTNQHPPSSTLISPSHPLPASGRHERYNNDTTASASLSSSSPARRIIRRRQLRSSDHSNHELHYHNRHIQNQHTTMGNNYHPPLAATAAEHNDIRNENSDMNDDEYDDLDDVDNNENRNSYDNNSNNNNDIDDILNRCYFWSFLFQHSHPTNDHIVDSIYNLDQDEQPQQQRFRIVPLISCTILFVFIGWLGMHSMIQIQNTLSTDFVSLFAVSSSNRENHNNNNNNHHHHHNRTYVTETTKTSYSNNELPIIVVLSSGEDKDALTVASTTTYPLTNNDTTHCLPNTKISHHGTVQYKYGQEYTNGLEQYLIDRIKNETKSSHQSNTTLFQSNNLNATNTTYALPTVRVTSFYSYMANGLEWWARSRMATPDGTSVFVQIQYSTIDIESNRTDDTNHPSSSSSIMNQEYNTRQILINAIDEFTDLFDKQYDSKNLSTPLCLTIHPTGVPYLEVQLSNSIHQLSRTILVLVLPFVIVLLSLMMWYSYNAVLLWVWIIPFVTIVMSVSILCIILQYIMIPYIPSSVSIFTLLIMIIMSLATTSVHVISLLSRYLEEMGEATTSMMHRRVSYQQTSPSPATRRMLKSSGSTMISSGCINIVILTIFLSSSTSLLFRSFLISIMIATVTTSGINIFMMSTILEHTPLGQVILTKNTESTISSRELSYESEGQHQTQYDDAELNHQHQESNRYNHTLLAESFAAQMLPTPRKSIWFCIARNIVHPYRAIILILVILQLLLPVAFHVKRNHLSYQPMNVLSTSGKSIDSYRKLGRHIGHGRLYPYKIVFDGHASNVSMTSKIGFELMHSVINEIQSRSWLPLSLSRIIDATDMTTLDSSLSFQNHNLDSTQLKYDMFNGISVIQNTVVTFDMFLAAKYCAPSTRKKHYCPFELLRMIAATNEQMTSNDTFATYTLVELGVDPFSSAGIEWLKNARYKIDRLRQTNRLEGVQVDIIGSSALVYDSAMALYKPVHVLMYMSIVTIAIFLAVFFRSIFLPIRSALTIWLTTSFSMGLAVSVYQDGILNWTKIASLQSNTESEGLCWLVPALAFPVIVGLSLIFDAQLISRVLEFREQGYEHKSSIALGLDTVGGCNTYAGMILTFIFGAPMIFGENRMLSQWSFVVVSAILIDTLVIRTIIIPVFIGSVSINWWPRKLPTEMFFLEEFNFRNPLHVDDSIGENPNTYWETLITSSEYEPLHHNR